MKHGCWFSSGSCHPLWEAPLCTAKELFNSSHLPPDNLIRRGWQHTVCYMDFKSASVCLGVVSEILNSTSLFPANVPWPACSQFRDLKPKDTKVNWLKMLIPSVSKHNCAFVNLNSFKSPLFLLGSRGSCKDRGTDPQSLLCQKQTLFQEKN